MLRSDCSASTAPRYPPVEFRRRDRTTAQPGSCPCFEVSVVSFGDGGSDQLAAYVVGAFHLAFVLQFKFAGDGGIAA